MLHSCCDLAAECSSEDGDHARSGGAEHAWIPCERYAGLSHKMGGLCRNYKATVVRQIVYPCMSFPKGQACSNKCGYGPARWEVTWVWQGSMRGQHTDARRRPCDVAQQSPCSTRLKARCHVPFPRVVRCRIGDSSPCKRERRPQVSPCRPNLHGTVYLAQAESCMDKFSPYAHGWSSHAV